MICNEDVIKLLISRGADKKALTDKGKTYVNRFDRGKTRFINWELNLEHLSSGHRKDFIIKATYYKPDGGKLMQQTQQAYADKGWNSSWHSLSWGWRQPGQWKPGRYTAVLSVTGKKVVEGSFEVY